MIKKKYPIALQLQRLVLYILALVVNKYDRYLLFSIIIIIIIIVFYN